MPDGLAIELHRQGPIGAHLHAPCPRQGQLGVVKVTAHQHTDGVPPDIQEIVALEEVHVQLAIVELRLGRYPHGGAVELGIRHQDHEHALPRCPAINDHRGAGAAKPEAQGDGGDQIGKVAKPAAHVAVRLDPPRNLSVKTDPGPQHEVAVTRSAQIDGVHFSLDEDPRRVEQRRARERAPLRQAEHARPDIARAHGDHAEDTVGPREP